jgi:hypothetical protein
MDSISAEGDRGTAHRPVSAPAICEHPSPPIRALIRSLGPSVLTWSHLEPPEAGAARSPAGYVDLLCSISSTSSRFGSL